MQRPADAELIKARRDFSGMERWRDPLIGVVFVAFILHAYLGFILLSLAAAFLWRAPTVRTWQVPAAPMGPWNDHGTSPIHRLTSLYESTGDDLDHLLHHRAWPSEPSRHNGDLGPGWSEAYHLLDYDEHAIRIPGATPRRDDALEHLWIAFGDRDQVLDSLVARVEDPDSWTRERACTWLLKLAPDDPRLEDIVRDAAHRLLHEGTDSDARAMAALHLGDPTMLMGALNNVSPTRQEELLQALEDMNWGPMEVVTQLARRLPANQFSRIMDELLRRPSDAALRRLLDDLARDDPRATMLVDAVAALETDRAILIWVHALHQGHAAGRAAARHLSAHANDTLLDALALQIPEGKPEFVGAAASLFGAAGRVDHIAVLRAWEGRNEPTLLAIEHAVRQIQQRVPHQGTGGLSIATGAGGLTKATTGGLTEAPPKR